MSKSIALQVNVVSDLPRFLEKFHLSLDRTMQTFSIRFVLAAYGLSVFLSTGALMVLETVAARLIAPD
jgi:hypothetical protein